MATRKRRAIPPRSSRRGGVTTALAAVIACLASATAQSDVATQRLQIVAGGGDPARAAVELAMEMLDEGEHVTFVTGAGRRVLNDRRIRRGELRGSRSAPARGVAKALSSLEEPDVIDGLREIAPGLAPGDRLIVISGEPQPTTLAAQLGAALLGGRGATLQVMWPGGADALLVETPALAGGGVHELEVRPTPRSVARLLGGRFYRGGSGEFPLPGGTGDLIVFAPFDSVATILSGGEPVSADDLVEHELEPWKTLRLADPQPGTYELEGVPPGQSALVVARLPWAARVWFEGSGVVEIEVASRDAELTPFAPELRVVATFRRQDGRLDMLPAVCVDDIEGQGSPTTTRWRTQLVAGACGQLIIDLELLSGEQGATGWRLREILSVCGASSPESAAGAPADRDPGRRAEPPDDSPPDRGAPTEAPVVPALPPASLRVEPALLDLGTLEQGATSSNGRIALERTDGASVLLKSLRAHLKDAGGRIIAVECVPSMHLPADLGAGRVEVGVAVRLQDATADGRLSGALDIEVGGVEPVSIPIEVFVVPVVLSFDPSRVAIAIPLDALPAVEPFEAMLTASASTPRTLRLKPLRSAASGLEVELTGSSVMVSRQNPVQVTGRVRIDASLRPGRYRAAVLARGPGDTSVELEIEVEVLPPSLALASQELRLAPLGADGGVLFASTTLAGAAGLEVEVLASLQRGPTGARAVGHYTDGRVTVVVAVPDDEVGGPIEGMASVVATGGTSVRRFQLPFSTQEGQR